MSIEELLMYWRRVFHDANALLSLDLPDQAYGLARKMRHRAVIAIDRLERGRNG